MAHMWIPSTRTEDARWAALPLRSHRLSLVPGSDLPLRRTQDTDAQDLALCGSLIRIGDPGPQEAWLLTSSPGGAVHINGQQMRLGQQVLRHKDEIRLPGGQRLLFSTERVAEIVPFPGGAEPAYCARCKTEITRGSPAVRCPSCGLWHHQSEEYGCWHYPGTSTCSGCSHPNDREAKFRWVPTTL